MIENNLMLFINSKGKGLSTFHINFVVFDMNNSTTPKLIPIIYHFAADLAIDSVDKLSPIQSTLGVIRAFSIK